MKLSTSNTLCTHLWNHAVVDLTQKRFRACCKTQSIQVSNEEISALGEDLFLNHPVFVADRKAMLKGEKPDRCNVCWKMESEGNFSYRNGPEAWHNYFSPLAEKMPNPSLSQFPDNLDIQLDNYCDLKCIYCNEEFSSQWQNEKVRHGELLPPRSSSVNPELEKIFFRWFENVKMHFKRIAFLGGEPLISPTFYDYFEKILKCYQGNFPADLEFNIITNLNTPTATFERFTALLQLHKADVKFNINISMESWGKRAELIRSNLDFNRFRENFRKLSELDHRITLSTITSVNVLSISTLAEYLRFLIELEKNTGRKIILYPNLISYPQWLSVSLAPDEFFERYIQECIWILQPHSHHDDYRKFLNSLSGKFQFEILSGTELHLSFLREIKTISERRNISYEDVFKEYGYLWNANLDQ